MISLNVTVEYVSNNKEAKIFRKINFSSGSNSEAIHHRMLIIYVSPPTDLHMTSSLSRIQNIPRKVKTFEYMEMVPSVGVHIDTCTACNMW